MALVNLNAVFTLWLRDMKRFIRARSRLIGSFVMPFMFLGFLGMGMGTLRLPGMPPGMSYIGFLAPGILGMTLLFSSMTAGLSVLWDKEFGFLKEVMVTPVNRFSIVLGRTLGAVTTALIQAILILMISIGMGVTINWFPGFPLALVFMVLIAVAFIGLGIAFASKLGDMEGFSLVMNFIVMPAFLLSGALFPLTMMPEWVRYICYIDPLTYGVDGLRGALVGMSTLPLFLDLVILVGICIGMLGLGAYLFEKTEV